MARKHKMPVSRRGFIAGAGTLAGTLGFPLIGGAQPAGVKVGIIHPVTGFVAFAGGQGRFGANLAVDDINKAGGIKAMGGAKLDPLFGDSQSKVEVGAHPAHLVRCEHGRRKGEAIALVLVGLVRRQNFWHGLFRC